MVAKNDGQCGADGLVRAGPLVRLPTLCGEVRALVKRFWKRHYRPGTGIRKRLPSGETSQNNTPDGT